MHMYGGLWDDWGDISDLEVVKLYSVGRRLAIKNLAELAVKTLSWVSEKCVVLDMMDTMEEMIKIVYTETPNVDNLDRQARDALVDWVAKDYFYVSPFSREWYQGLFEASSAFAFDFALKISKRDWPHDETPKAG